MNIKLINVRLSFPALFKPRSFGNSDSGDNTQGEPKYSATFLMDKEKHSDLIEQIQDGIKALMDEKYGEGKYKLKAFKSCLRDGVEKEDTEGYGEDIMFVSARSAKRIPIVDRDLTPLSEEDGKPYAGCFVNASIRLWVQDNKWGKRVNAALRTVQFVKDGEAFGEKPADPEEEFKDLGEDEDGDETPRGKKSGKKSML